MSITKKIEGKARLREALAQLDSVELYMAEQNILSHYEYWINAKNKGWDMPKPLTFEQWYNLIPKIKRLWKKYL